MQSEWADDGDDSLRGFDLGGQWDSVLATGGYVVGIEVSGRGQRVAVADLRGQIVERTPVAGDASLSADELRHRLRSLVTETLGEGECSRRTASCASASPSVGRSMPGAA